jgi:uncharacterized Zn finger protein
MSSRLRKIECPYCASHRVNSEEYKGNLWYRCHACGEVWPSPKMIKTIKKEGPEYHIWHE